MARRLSSGVGLLMVGILVGAMIAPASAHVTSKFGHLWNQHIAPKLAAEGYVSGPHVVSEAISVPNGSNDYYSSTSATIECPAGEKALGGGYYAGTVSQAFSVATNRPMVDGTGWELYLHNEAGYTVEVTGYAVCAK